MTTEIARRPRARDLTLEAVGCVALLVALLPVWLPSILLLEVLPRLLDLAIDRALARWRGRRLPRAVAVQRARNQR